MKPGIDYAKGPWRTRKLKKNYSGSNKYIMQVVAPGFHLVADAVGCGLTASEWGTERAVQFEENNCRLLAAAPEMYEQLRRLYHDQDFKHKDLDQIRDLLEKIDTGRKETKA